MDRDETKIKMVMKNWIWKNKLRDAEIEYFVYLKVLFRFIFKLEIIFKILFDNDE